jgi:LPXTG-motif cell wall-anchored protein
VLQRLTTTAMRRRMVLGSVMGAVMALTATALGAGVAGADSGWSRVPSSGLAGGTVDVASSSSTLCQWIQPADAGGTSADTASTQPAPGTGGGSAEAVPSDGDVVYDGTEVQVRLSQGGTDVPLGELPVAIGGAWSGTVTLPTGDALRPGAYDLFVKCVIDRPELDGLRTYDFDPLGFTVTEGPPPTTVEVPTELVPPLVATNPVQVQGEQITRPATTPAPAPAATTATSPTLPNTGDGTVGIALAGFGALLVGGAALWWGARSARRHAPDLLD